jgi:RNA-directed DNA polymerase
MKERERYEISKNPLYRLRSKVKLAKLLKITTSQLKALITKEDYRVHTDGKREYQTPIGLNRHVHNKLKTFIGRIYKPDFVFSGKPGISYVDNGKTHQQSSHVLKLDIKRFYNNTKSEYVFRFFKYQLKMPDDIAFLLAQITTYENHIPTGSPLSQLLSFWSYSDLFSRIKELCDNEGYIFSLYVDDMTISFTRPIPTDLHLRINQLLKAYMLKLKNPKTKYLGPTRHKVITGCAITPNGLLKLPNKNRLKVIKMLKASNDLHDIEYSDNIRFKSLLFSCQQVEPNIFAHTMLRVDSNTKAP